MLSPILINNQWVSVVDPSRLVGSKQPAIPTTLMSYYKGNLAIPAVGGGVGIYSVHMYGNCRGVIRQHITRHERPGITDKSDTPQWATAFTPLSSLTVYTPYIKPVHFKSVVWRPGHSVSSEDPERGS
jgi:hypothetical protein